MDPEASRSKSAGSMEGMGAAGAARGEGERKPFRPQVRRSLRMHKKLAVAVALIVCLLVVFEGLQQGGTYTATTRVFVDPVDPGSINPQGSPGYDQLRYVSYVDQQMQTVTRADVLALALRTLPAGTWQGPNETEQAAVGRLAKVLKVERLNDGYEFSISLSSPNATTAAAVVNAVAKAYLDGGRKDELKQADGRAQTLNEERERIKADLDVDLKEQTALAANLGVANPATDGTNAFDAQLVNLRGQLMAAREAHDVAAAKLASVSGGEAQQRSGLAAAADDSISTDQGLGSMKSAVNSRRTILESAMAGMTANNPMYKQDQEELANLNRMQDAEVTSKRSQAEQRIEESLRTDLQRTSAVESKLNAQLAQNTLEATSAEPKLLRAQELASDIRRLNDRYTAVDGLFRTLELQTHGPGMAHVATAAEPPAMPESNRRNLFLMAALPLSLMMGLAAAVLARMVDQRIYLADDVEAVAGFSPLAVLPEPGEVSNRVFEEHVLRLAAGIEGAYRRTRARTFVFAPVSASTEMVPVVNAVAKKLEELRLSTAVVRAHELLLTSAETAMYQAQAMPSENEARAAVSDGIASQKLERMKWAHDVVLVAGSAILRSAETEYAARCADVTMLLVDSRKSVRTELKAALELLARLQVKGVALVLANVRLRDADGAFGEGIEAAESRDEPEEVRREPAVMERVAERSANAMDTVTVELEEQEAAEASVPVEEQVETAEEPLVEAARDEPVEDEVDAMMARALQMLDDEPVERVAEAVEMQDAEMSGVRRAPIYLLTAGGGSEKASGPVLVMEQALPEGAEREETGVDDAISAAMLEEPLMVDDGGEVPDDLQGSAGLSEGIAARIAKRMGPGYKEPRLNSKATWLNHLFRGDQAATIKIVPDEDGYRFVGSANGERTGRATPEPEPELEAAPAMPARAESRLEDAWPLKARAQGEEPGVGRVAEMPARGGAGSPAQAQGPRGWAEEESAPEKALTRRWALLERFAQGEPLAENGAGYGVEQERQARRSREA